MAESAVVNKLKEIDKQRQDILGTYIKEHQELIKQKKVELKKLEDELEAVVPAKRRGRKPRAVKTAKGTRGPVKAAAKASTLSPALTKAELKGVLEGLGQGIKDDIGLKPFLQAGRRATILKDVREAYKKLNPKERTPEAFEEAIKAIKAARAAKPKK
ncbi:MAG: hypothetical protein ACLQMF_14105 [Rectinemataceae bacterium]